MISVLFYMCLVKLLLSEELGAESYSFTTQATAKQHILRLLTLAELKPKIYRKDIALTLVLPIT